MIAIDEPLFRAAQSGDGVALEHLLKRVQPDVRRYALYQCQKSSAVEDVVQEALFVLYRRVGTINSLQSLGAWLFKTVTRLCMLPALMFMRHVEDIRLHEEAAQFARMPTDALRMDIVRALESLSDSQRQIILMRDVQEMSIAEIAEALAISREASKARLHRARVCMREFLTPIEPTTRGSRNARSKDAP